MTTKTCPACASSNAVDAAFCTQCGSPFEPGRSAPAVSQVPPPEPAKIPEVETPPPVIRSPEPAPRPATWAAQSTVQGEKEMPCIVKAAGGFFGCLFGLIAGLCVSLICVMPVTYAISGGSGTGLLEVAIIITVILVIITTIFGIIMGPGFLGRILTSIGDTFKWMTGSGRGK